MWLEILKYGGAAFVLVAITIVAACMTMSGKARERLEGIEDDEPTSERLHERFL